ncbi:hypothetical protein PIB30_046891 [Stylosanthes scabra]|uniref:Uncharacterized protein n=1 Tax=Stylosanthes scabra TaxID=79078 RepID=A0ABU6TGB5_9FABA|nr:hypothetical protein [Stylosanthes scabra]
MGKNSMGHAIIILIIIGVVICSCNGEFQKVTLFDDITIKDESSKKYITIEKAIAECMKLCEKLHEYPKNLCILNCCIDHCSKQFRDVEFWPCVMEFTSKYITDKKE